MTTCATTAPGRDALRREPGRRRPAAARARGPPAARAAPGRGVRPEHVAEQHGGVLDGRRRRLAAQRRRRQRQRAVAPGAGQEAPPSSRAAIVPASPPSTCGATAISSDGHHGQQREQLDRRLSARSHTSTLPRRPARGTVPDRAGSVRSCAALPNGCAPGSVCTEMRTRRSSFSATFATTGVERLDGRDERRHLRLERRDAALLRLGGGAIRSTSTSTSPMRPSRSACSVAGQRLDGALQLADLPRQRCAVGGFERACDRGLDAGGQHGCEVGDRLAHRFDARVACRHQRRRLGRAGRPVVFKRVIVHRASLLPVAPGPLPPCQAKSSARRRRGSAARRSRRCGTGTGPRSSSKSTSSRSRLQPLVDPRRPEHELAEPVRDLVAVVGGGREPPAERRAGRLEHAVCGQGDEVIAGRRATPRRPAAAPAQRRSRARGNRAP